MTKHIYIYSPSSAVRDKAAFRRGVKRLKALGHEVEVDDAALSAHQRFAGDDATRLAAISRAAASGADVALIARGGYGLTRILDAIPYKALAKAIEKGTEFVGCSDFTALQNALLVKTGVVTWSGPAVGEDFGAEGGPDDIMEACFDDLLTGQGEGTGWRMPARDADLKFKPVQDAVLWGGNLCVLASLLGTPPPSSRKPGRYTRFAAPGFFCAPSIMACVGLLAEAEVQALRSLDASVWGPALSARCTARTVPARSTTVAATL